jgi:hypothetical protein
MKISLLFCCYAPHEADRFSLDFCAHTNRNLRAFSPQWARFSGWKTRLSRLKFNALKPHLLNQQPNETVCLVFEASVLRHEQTVLVS